LPQKKKKKKKSKRTKTKKPQRYVPLRAGGVAQVIEPLPSKGEALNSSPRNAKKKKKSYK
jgi:hypothetical protein